MKSLFLAFAALICLMTARPALGQASESANAGHGLLWVGVGGTGATLDFGQRKMIGPTIWVDLDSLRRFGFEGEVRLLDYQQTANVHAETYLGGGRYHLNYGRFQPYVKGLVGSGHFNFSYNYATGNYLVVGYGGGLDYRLNGRFKARAEAEVQQWPQFTYGSMNSYGVSVGLRCRIF